jgi:processive 1,2-diacylglycerol beta-glucosyltransferase
MKQIFLFFLCLFFGFSTTNAADQTAQKETTSLYSTQTESASEVLAEKSKPKMIIFSSMGGYGHQAASEELEQIFKADYQVKTVYWLEDGPFKKHDLVRTLSFGFSSGESLYNFLLKNQWMHSLRLVCKQGPFFIKTHKKTLEKSMLSYLQEEEPDFIISVAPIFNLPAINAATELAIPYLLITLDADLTSWSIGLEETREKKFDVTIGYDAPKTRTMLHALRVPDKNIHRIGFPIHKKFLKPQNKKRVCEKWKLREHVPIILIMMGGIGTSTAYTYAEQIARLPQSAEVLVCAGKNKALKRNLKRLKPVSRSMKIHALDFVYNIEELMFIADLLITKGGGMTLYQAIAAQTPLICHAIGSQLPWEEENIRFITNNHLGFAINHLNEVNPLVKRLLDQPFERTAIKKRMLKYHPINFHAEIKKLVEKIKQRNLLEREEKTENERSKIKNEYENRKSLSIHFQQNSWFSSIKQWIYKAFSS